MRLMWCSGRLVVGAIMDYRPCGDLGSLIGKNSRRDSVTKARVRDRRRVGAGQRNVRRGIIASKTGLSTAQPGVQ